MTSLTPKQAEALFFIEKFQEQHRYSPSLREISAGLGKNSVSSAKHLVDELSKKGYISHHKGVARGITVLNETGI